jgi:hypothetical protein
MLQVWEVRVCVGFVGHPWLLAVVCLRPLQLALCTVWDHNGFRFMTQECVFWETVINYWNISYAVCLSAERNGELLLWTLLLVCSPGDSWWNDIDRVKPKDSEKNLSQCHFVHHKSHRLTWARSGASAVISRRLISWAMALLSSFFKKNHFVEIQLRCSPVLTVVHIGMLAKAGSVNLRTFCAVFIAGKHPYSLHASGSFLRRW